MTTLGLEEIRGLSNEQLFQRKPVVIASLKRRLEVFRSTDAAVELIDEWSNQKGIHNAIAYELQEKMAEETGRLICNSCHWVPKPGQTNCCEDPSLDIIEPLDDYPEDATIEDWDNAFGSTVNNPDDDLVELNSPEYSMTRI